MKSDIGKLEDLLEDFNIIYKKWVPFNVDKNIEVKINLNEETCCNFIFDIDGNFICLK